MMSTSNIYHCFRQHTLSMFFLGQSKWSMCVCVYIYTGNENWGGKPRLVVLYSGKNHGWTVKLCWPVLSYEIQQKHNVLGWPETENGYTLCRNIKSYLPVNTVNTLQCNTPVYSHENFRCKKVIKLIINTNISVVPEWVRISFTQKIYYKEININTGSSNHISEQVI